MHRGGSSGPTPAEPGASSSPTYGARLNDAASLTVRKARTTIDRPRATRGGSPARGDYPVEFEKVKEALVELADFKVIESKTSNPELYGQLGVGDPAPDNTTSSW